MPSTDPTSGGAVLGVMAGFTTLFAAAVVLIVGAGVAAVLIYIITKIPESQREAIATELGLGVAVIVAGVFTVMMFVCMFCSTIHPTEMFVGTGPAPGDTVSAQTPSDTLLNGITDAEQKVCYLVQRVDKFIESDIGKPGQDDPSLVVAAQRKARAAVPGGQIVDCTVGSPEPTLADADTRLTLMENTLKWFTGPELESTYKKSMVGCEGFSDYMPRWLEGFVSAATIPDNSPAPVVDLAAFQQRLNTIVSEIADQHRQYLDPVDKQTERLNRGEVSDCQKKMGANAGADAAASSKPLPPGTSMSDITT
jgi:hypothetical protein